MSFVYASTASLPTTKAHGLQIIENCAAFAAAGAEVTLVLAHRRRAGGLSSSPDLFAHYGVPRAFRVESLPCLDLPVPFPALAPMAFRLMSATFGVGLLARVRHLQPEAVVYSRDPLPLVIAGSVLPPSRLVFEAHQLPVSAAGRWLHERCLRSVGLVVAVTKALAAASADHGARATLVARDGYRVDRFADMLDRSEARRLVGLPTEAFVVGYVGQLHTMDMPKGVEVLVDAAALLRDVPVTVCVVGGPEDLVDALRRRWQQHGLASDRFVSPGQVPPSMVPPWLASFDVGAIPFPFTRHFAECASPLKLFEYLAAGLPIVASDLPSMREVLEDEKTALLVPSSNAEAFAAAIRRLHSDIELRRDLAIRARHAAAEHTWETRGRRILRAISTLGT